MNTTRLSGSRTRRAFTLLELTVVVVVLGILAGLATPSYESILNSARYDTALSDAISSAKGAIAWAATTPRVPTYSDFTTSAADQPGITVASYTPGASFATILYNVNIGGYPETVCVTVPNRVFSTPQAC